MWRGISEGRQASVTNSPWLAAGFQICQVFCCFKYSLQAATNTTYHSVHLPAKVIRTYTYTNDG